MTLREYLEIWLQTYVEPFRRPHTVECYERAIASLPCELANTELTLLDSLHIQHAINTQARSTPRAAQLTFATLHVALAKAVRLRMLPYSPMDACDKPAHEPKRTAILTVQQLQAYQQAARESDCWPLLLLMSACGLRRGEALGVCWTDINGGVLTVRHQRMREQGRYELCPLKSKASNRVLKLADPIKAELYSWPVRGLRGFVVDTTPEHLANEHAAAIRRAKLPHITPHGLRHSMATALVATGTPIKVMQAILGHSDYSLTADLYADHMQDAGYTAPELARMCRMMM